MKIEELIRKDLLKTTRPDRPKSDQSINVAAKKLEEAEKACNAEIYESTMIFAYMAMFHAARAILFKEGFMEKSHYAVVMFLQERFSAALGIGLISKLDSMRTARHEGLYGLHSDFSEEDAKMAILDAKEFLEKVRKLLRPITE
jgi:uncharacterized protein (UPF0332 family)